MKVLCIFVSMVMAIKADYHEEFGIPLAARIKEYEDKLFADVPEMESRVYGGEFPQELAHPFVASLIVHLGKRLSLCAASLVKTDRLVTAAHCLYGAQEQIEARLGSQYVYHEGTVFECKDYSIHPDYNRSNSRNNDIGFVRLPQAVELSDTIKVIDVPWYRGDDNDIEIIGEWALTYGWGRWNNSDFISVNMRLRETSLRIIMETACEDQYKLYHMHGNIICADGAGYQRSVCEGDAGGPLVVERDGRKVLVGIIAFGHPRCDKGYPSVFMRLKSYLIFVMDAQ